MLTLITDALPLFGLALGLLLALLAAGSLLGKLLGMHRWGIPEALLAGSLGLLIAPSGVLPLIPPAVIHLWDQLPLILLTLVFATLLLGKPLPAIGGLWRPLSAQVLMALTLAFGQYLVAGLAVLLVLQPLVGAPAVMACLIEVAFEGGHGSAAAMGPTYARLGLESGEALGLAMATVGLLASTLVGGLVVVLARRRRWLLSDAPLGEVPDVPLPPVARANAAQAIPGQSTSLQAFAGAAGLSGQQPELALQPPDAEPLISAAGVSPDQVSLTATRQAPSGQAQAAPAAGSTSEAAHAPSRQPLVVQQQAPQQPTSQQPPSQAGLSPGDPAQSGAATPSPAVPAPIARAAVNLALTGVAVALGWGMLEGLRHLADSLGGGFAMVIEVLPVFPLALVGSLLVRLGLERSGQAHWASAPVQNRIGTISADLLITAATACLDLSLLAKDWLPLTVLAVVGLIWNLAVLLLLAPRILPASWFERGLIEFGQATGVAASGLLLLNMVDPDDRNGTLTPFSIKQLILQPLLAGGVITVVAPLAVDSWGLPIWTAFCLALVVLWISLGLWLAGRRAVA